MRNPLEKVPDSNTTQKFIPNVLCMAMNPTNLKYGGPQFLPSNKDYGNFP